MNKNCKISAFILPVMPWALYAMSCVAIRFFYDSEMQMAFAIFIVWATIILALVLGTTGMLYSLRCRRETRRKRYRVSLVLGAVSFYCGLLLLLRLIGLM